MRVVGLGVSVVLLAQSGVCVAAGQDCDERHTRLEEPIRYDDATLHALPVCYNHTCRCVKYTHITAVEWDELLAHFRTVASSAVEERERVRKAVALLEYFVGKRTPTYKDKGLTSNALEVGWPGQQDCIDEATNTTTYLILLDKHGLLKWHEVGKPLYRNYWYKFFIDPHFSAHLVETDSGQSYVVDSWFLDNGQPPYVATREDWLSKQGGWE